MKNKKRHHSQWPFVVEPARVDLGAAEKAVTHPSNGAIQVRSIAISPKMTKCRNAVPTDFDTKYTRVGKPGSHEGLRSFTKRDVAPSNP